MLPAILFGGGLLTTAGLLFRRHRRLQREAPKLLAAGSGRLETLTPREPAASEPPPFDRALLGLAPPPRPEIPEAPASADAHLPDSLAHAVALAAAVESNPDSLRDFSNALLPDYPAAASALAARAALLTMAKEHRTQERLNGKLDLPLEVDETGVLEKDPLAQVRGLAGNLAREGVSAAFVIGNGQQTFVPLAATTFSSQGKPPVVIADPKTEALRLATSKVFSDAVLAFDKAHPAIFAAMIASAAGKPTTDAAKLDSLLTFSAQTMAHALTDKSELGSLLSAAGLLAMKRRLPDGTILVAEASVPAVADAMKAGELLSEKFQSERTIKERLPQDFPPNARHAFAVGLVLGLARILQDADFKRAVPLLFVPSGTVTDQVLESIRIGLDADLVPNAAALLQQSLLLLRRDNGPEIQNTPDQARHVAASIVQAPELSRLRPNVLGERLGVPEAVARAVLASTSFEVPGAPLLDPDKLRSLVGDPSAPAGADRLHIKLALKAAQGDPSAAKQMSFARTQTPADAPSIDAAQRMARRAIWLKRYLDIERAAAAGE